MKIAHRNPAAAVARIVRASLVNALPLTGPELRSDRVPFVFRNAPNRFHSCSVGAPKTFRESPRPSYETEQNGTKRNTFFRNRLGNHRIAQAVRDQPQVFGTESRGTIRACWPLLVGFGRLRSFRIRSSATERPHLTGLGGHADAPLARTSAGGYLDCPIPRRVKGQNRQCPAFS